MPTGEVFELDIGLGAVGIEIGVLGVHVEGLCVEIDGKIEVIVDEGFLRPRLEIRRHSRRKREHRNERKGEKRRGINKEETKKARRRRTPERKKRRHKREGPRRLQGSRRFFSEATDTKSGPLPLGAQGLKGIDRDMEGDEGLDKPDEDKPDEARYFFPMLVRVGRGWDYSDRVRTRA